MSSEFFQPEKRHRWEPKLKALAELNIPAKSIADSFGCSYTTLTHNEEVMRIIRAGWAFYRGRIELELWLLATEVPGPNATPEEVNNIRQSRLKACTQIHKMLHKDPWTPPAEEERIRRLSDEELKQELKRVYEEGIASTGRTVTGIK